MRLVAPEKLAQVHGRGGEVGFMVRQYGGEETVFHSLAPTGCGIGPAALGRTSTESLTDEPDPATGRTEPAPSVQLPWTPETPGGSFHVTRRRRSRSARPGSSPWSWQERRGNWANLEKKVWKGRTIASEDFEDEAADVCIALLNFANSRGIDLAAAVEAKMRRIDERRRIQPEPATD